MAGVIVEPFQRLIPPKPGFLQALRAVTQKHGIPLIFDEVVTGFRFAYGGAQEYYGVTPDLCTLGKIVGGGFALAAIAGRADIMKHFDRLAMDDEDFIFQVGTLSGNPVAAVAGLATLEVLKRPGAYEQVFATGRELMGALSGLLKNAGIKAQVIGEPPLVRRRLHRPADQGLSRHAQGRQGDGRALQPAFARPRHHEGREQVLCQPGPRPRRHRPHDRRMDGGGEGTSVILSAAKDLMPVASGDEILRCAQDDNQGPSNPFFFRSGRFFGSASASSSSSAAARLREAVETAPE